LRLGLRDDREDLDFLVGDVIEHPCLTHPKSVLGLSEPLEALDPALAQLRRLEPKMQLDTIPNLGSGMGRKSSLRPTLISCEPPTGSRAVNFISL
jgi:hypothetical protein